MFVCTKSSTPYADVLFCCQAAMPEEVTEASDFNAALAAAGVQPPAENGAPSMV